MRQTLLCAAFLSLCVCAPSAKAGGSVFSKDGSRIYLSPLWEKGKLWVINSETHEGVLEDLSGSIGDMETGTLARTPEGDILIEAGGAIWKWTPGGKKPVKLAAVPKGLTTREISCASAAGKHAQAGTVFLAAYNETENRDELLALLPGARAFKPVFIRRLQNVTAPPAFSGDGRMFFGGDFDLWEGTLEKEEDVEDRAGTLTGSRLAPLAVANTDGANSGSMGVREVAAAGNKVYALVSGRHMGAVVTVTRPAEDRYDSEAAEHPGAGAAYKLMADTLAKAAVIFDGGNCDALCVHQAGKTGTLVFFRAEGESPGRDWMLYSVKGAPVKIGGETRPDEDGQ